MRGRQTRCMPAPYARCLQTLEPLAKLLNRKVIADQRLREAQPFEPIIEWLAIAPEGAVLCSHGDLIPDVIAALERRACVITTEPHWAKASVWVLERNGEGTVIRASSWPPPNLD